MTSIRDLHAGWMQELAYRREYAALEPEFAPVATLIRVRADAGLTQEEPGAGMETEQEVIARWEGGKAMPSTRTLARLAKATGTQLRIVFAPAGGVVEATG